MTFTNRIVRYGLEPVDSILFHPSNWRIHPVRQADAVKGALTKVGWVETVIINLRTGEAWPQGDRNVATLTNGHLRVTLAAKAGDSHVPTLYVDLDPEEEAFVLATLDPLGALAGTDANKLLELAGGIEAQNEIIKAALRGAGVDIRETFAHITGSPAEPEPGGGPKPHEPQVHANLPANALTGNGSGQAGSGQAVTGQASANKPADREKYPLAIVLDRRDYDRWTAWKTAADAGSDTAALKALLDKAIDWMEA